MTSINVPRDQILLPAAEANLASRLGRLKQGTEAEKVAKVLDAAPRNRAIEAFLDRAAPASVRDVDSAEGAESPQMAGHKLTLDERLKSLSAGDMRRVMVALANHLFADGQGKVSKASPATVKFLRDVAKDLAVDSVSDEKRTATAAKIIDFAQDRSKRHEMPDVLALGAAYAPLVAATDASRQDVLKSVPGEMLRKLKNSGVVELSKLGAGAEQKLKPLLDAGLASIRDGFVSYSLASRANPTTLAAHLSPAQMTSIGDAISGNLDRFATKGLPLFGVSSKTSAGMREFALQNEVRLARIAEEAGASVSEVMVYMRHLERQGLVESDNRAGFRMTPMGAANGLAYGGLTRVSQLTAGAKQRISGVPYLDAVEATREAKALPEVSRTTRDGGLGNLFVIDEAMIGSGWNDPKLTRKVLEDIDRASRDPDTLVVLSNLTSGTLAMLQAKVRRTMVPGWETLSSQLEEARNLFVKPGTKTVILTGPYDRNTAQTRTAEQFVREQGILREQNRITKREAAKSVERLNPINFNKLQEMDPSRWSEIERFMMHIALPYCYHQGRDLLDVDDVRASLGIDMTEFEVLELAVAAMESKNVAERKNLAPLVDFDLLERILKSDTNELAEHDLVVRDGLWMQMQNKDGKPGLSMQLHADFDTGGFTQRGDVLVIPANEIKSKLASGQGRVPDVFVFGGQGRTVIQTHDDTLLMSTPSLRGMNGEAFTDYDMGAQQDTINKRNRLRRGSPMSGNVQISGGVDAAGNKNGNYTFTFTNPKILQTLEANEKAGIPEREKKILLISDFQTGSPTMRPEQAVKQIVHALEEGVDHIFLNGDLIQGWNYPVFAQESQAFGPIDPQDQVEFVKQMLKVAIGETVRAKRAADPDYAPPKITITDGNHEWNSGDRKFPGRWLNPIRDMLAGIYDGLGVDGDKDVRYISEIDTKHGDHVFASAVYFDDIKEATGFGVFGQHCNYGASKGGKLGAPAEGMAAWTRARGVDTADNHFYLGAHYHTSSIVEEDGQVHIIAGAMAGQSAYEFARGYTDGEPASGMLTLNSREAPTLELVTARMVNGIEDGAIEAQGVAAKVAEHGSVEAWLQQLQEDCKMRAFHTHQMKTYGPGAEK